MRTFHFYVEDARCGAPKVFVVEAAGEARARVLAEQMLAQSEHHLGVEVCEDGRRHFGVGTFTDRSWCEPGPRLAAAG